MSSDNLPEFLAKPLADIAQSERFVQYMVQHKAGSNFGDGFMGDMLSVRLQGTRQTADGQLAEHRLALICKMAPSISTEQQKFHTSTVFAREVLMYNEILPRFERLQKERGLAVEAKFTAAPRCYFARHDADAPDQSVIIMQDLCSAGYRMWDKYRVSSVQCVRLFVQQLGRLHGLSFVLRDQQPEEFARIAAIPDVMLPVLETSGWTSMFGTAYDRAAAVLGDDEQNADAMRRMRVKFMDFFRRIFSVETVGKTAVLGHGDCWNNNMLFRFDGFQETTTAICLVDWQISHMSSPSADLCNYLLSSTDKPMRDQHMSEFLRVYHESAATIIRDFGSDPEKLFSYTDFETQLRKFGLYGVLMATMVLPVLMAKQEELVDLSEVAATGKEGEKEMTVMTEHTKEAYRLRLIDVMNDARAYGWLGALDEM